MTEQDKLDEFELVKQQRDRADLKKGDFCRIPKFELPLEITGSCGWGKDRDKYLGYIGVVTEVTSLGVKLDISDNMLWPDHWIIKVKSPDKIYNTRTFLNPIDSPSTGSIVCFDGYTLYDDGPYKNMFIEMSDCHVKARIHKTYEDSIDDFILKVKKLKTNIDKFYNHLLKTYKNE